MRVAMIGTGYVGLGSIESRDEATDIGGGSPVDLKDFIVLIEAALGREAIRHDLPMRPGDVSATRADTQCLEKLTGFRPEYYGI